MTALTEQSSTGSLLPAPKACCNLTVTRAATAYKLDRVAWDALIPRDSPHLRWGFLAAMEDSGQSRCPQYVQVWAGQKLVGVSVAYRLKIISFLDT